MTRWIISIIESGGYVGIAFLLFIEDVFPPIPSEFILPLCGYLAAQGKFGLFFVIISGTIGSILGAIPLYYLGYKLGEERLQKFAAKYGKWLTVGPRDIERADRWFQKHGMWAVFFCRLIPGFRSIISIPAGVNRMNLFTFLLFTAIGSSIWNTILTVGGYLLGSQFRNIEEYLDPFLYVIIAAVVIFYVFRLVRSNKDEETESVG